MSFELISVYMQINDFIFRIIEYTYARNVLKIDKITELFISNLQINFEYSSIIYIHHLSIRKIHFSFILMLYLINAIFFIFLKWFLYQMQ